MVTVKDIYNFDSITMNICNTCNLNCTYCFEKNKKEEFMDSETAIRILNQTYQDSKNIMVNIFGGEPFLNWETLRNILVWCGQYSNIQVGITTNGTIMTSEMANYIVSRNVHLLLSIDGMPDTHNKNRSDSFEKVKETIRLLQEKEIDKNNIEARMTILPEDAKNLYQNIMFLVEGLDLNYICPMPVTDVEWSEEELQNLKDNYKIILEKYLELNKNEDHPKIYIKNISDKILECMSEYIGDNEMCPIASHNWASFDTDGGIYQCHQIPTMREKFKFCIGNLEDGIDTEKMIHKLRFQYIKEECNNCKAKSICKGGCPIENYRLNGCMTMCGDSYCKTTRILAEAVSEFHDSFFSIEDGEGTIYKKLHLNLSYKRLIDNLNNEVNLNDERAIYKAIMTLVDFLNTNNKEELIESFKKHGDYVLTLVCSYLLSKKGGNIDVKLLKKLC